MSKINQFIPAQPGFSVLVTIIEQGVPVDVHPDPIVDWAFDNDGCNYPVTTHGIQIYGPSPAILFPDDRVDDLDQTWPSAEAWLKDQTQGEQNGT